MAMEGDRDLERRPLLAAEDEAEKEGLTTYGTVTASAVMLNYVVGTGCFGLPFAFQTTGLALGLGFLLFGTLYAFVTTNYTLEVLARTNGVLACAGRGPPQHRLGYRKYGFVAVGEHFAGPWGGRLIQLAMSAYALGLLWSCASMFASSTASLAFEYALDGPPCDIYASPSASCTLAFNVSLAVYGLVATGLALLDVGDQAWVQTALSLYRLLAFAVMVVTLAVKLAADGIVAERRRAEEMGLANWDRFALGFGATMVALTCQYNIPDAIQPLRNKAGARVATFTALLGAAVLNLLLGLGGALAFEHASQLVTLDWADYTACGSGWDPCPRSAVAVLVQLLVMLFPVVNVLSCFPLVVVTVGDNLRHMAEAAEPRLGARLLTTLCRLSVAVPPLVLAGLFRRLDLVFSITGLFGFLLAFTFPALLQWLTVTFCLRAWPDHPQAATTPDTWSPISNRPVVGCCLALSVACVATAVATLFN